MTTLPGININTNTANQKNAPSLLMEDWKHLTESSKNLNLGQYQTPRINRSLQGIEAEAQRLSSRPARHVSNTQLKNFAARAGVNIQNQKQYISAIGSLSESTMRTDMGPTQQSIIDYTMTEKSEQKESKKFEQQQKLRAAINTMDLQNFLKDHHNYVQSSIMNECQNKSNIKFKKQYELSMEEEWDCAKQDILSFFNVNNDEQIMEDEPWQRQSLLDYPKFIQQQKYDDTNINSTALNQTQLSQHNENQNNMNFTINDKEEMDYDPNEQEY